MNGSKNQRRQSLRRIGVEVEVIQYKDDGQTDEYGDSTSFTEERIESWAALSSSQRPEQRQFEHGEGLTDELRFMMPDDVDLDLASEEDSVKASRIHVPTTGHTYKVFAAFPIGSGAQRVLVRRVDKV